MAYTRPVLCRLCGFPAPDGGVPVSQVDREKLSEWCLRMMDTELDQEGLEEAIFCQFCFWHAGFLNENWDPVEKCRLPIWWKQSDHLIPEGYVQKYFLDDVFQPCAVNITVMSKELLQNHSHLSNSGTHRTQKRGKSVISICVYCSAQLESRVALERHVKGKHQNELTFRCSACKLFFLSSHEKNNHLEKYHRNWKIKCSLCPDHLSCKKTLACHLKEAHNKKIFYCNYKCKAYFTSEKARQVHVQDVHEAGEKVVCLYCEKHYLKSNLPWHIKTIHKSIYIKCNFNKTCATYFHTEEEREKHILEVHENGFDRVQCIYCHKKILKFGITSHMKSNHKHVQIRCHYFSCSTYFHTQEEKQKHVLDVHESRSELYRCIYCNIMMPRVVSKILQHMKTHKTEAIKCDYQFHCPNYFLTKEEKQEHILEVHESGQDKIRCQFCPRMVNIRGMSGHLIYHHKFETTGIEVGKVECIYCQRKMKESNLNSHMGRKHKVEAIRCNFNKKNCSSYFLTDEDRQKHLEQAHLTAKEEREMKCFFCTKVCTWPVLYRHIKKRHPDAIRCKSQGCKEYFPSKKEQGEHFEEVHCLQEKAKTFWCSHCPFVAPSKEERDVHNAQVHKKVTIKCPKCPKMLMSNRALARHIRAVHSARRECPHCKNQVRIATWVLHMRRSSCHSCKFAFSCRGMLSKHPQRFCRRSLQT